MPIYEYACKKCHAKFEHLARSMNGPQKVACPQCGSSQTVRALSLFAVGSQPSRDAASAQLPEMCQRCGGHGPCPGGFDAGD